MQEIGLVIIAILVLAIIIALVDHVIKERLRKKVHNSINESRSAALSMLEKTPLKDDEYAHRRAEILKSLPENYLDGYNKTLPK